MTDVVVALNVALEGRYRIERELGGGGMSRVFLANETTLDRQVVIKVLAPELAAVLSTERFAREVKLAARLQQANIVPVLSAGVADGVPFYTMPFVRGESLRARLAQGNRLSTTEAVGILRDILRALSYAHAEGIVHRDIKPENILLSGGAAVVTDFGIAKAIARSRTQGDDALTSSTITTVGTSIGTPAYMAPEQALGDPATDHRADLYAWGVVAWELLVGRHPFSTASTPHALIAAHVSETPADVAVARTDIPATLASIVRRCLEKDPVRRPSSAAEVLAALDDIATPQPAGAIAAPMRRARILAVVAVVVALTLVGFWWLHGRAAQEQSIAVLPFESVGGDTANAYFAEGMADELTTALASVQGLRVAATSSAFTYRGKTVDPREVGKALSVRAVLQGRVRRAGSVLRISAQLTNCTDGIVLWSRSFDREAKDVFAVQDDLTREIVGALRITLVGGPSTPLGQGTRDVAAHDLYLRGLYLLNKRGPGVAQSIPYFRQAIARDSTFAMAWAQLGTAYGFLPLFDFVEKDTALRAARVAIDRALQLDSLNAEAHAASGLVQAMIGQFDSADAAYHRSFDLDPNYVVAYRMALSLFATRNRDADALAAIRVLKERDPLSATTSAVIAMTQLSFGRRDDALGTAHRAMELDSMAPMSRAMLATTELAVGHADSARSQAARAIHTPNTLPWIGWVFSATGDQASAAALAREVEQQSENNPSAQLALAWIALGARDTARALEYLERSARAREPVSFMAPFGLPAYDPVRQSPRFAAAIRAFGADPAPFIRPPGTRR